MGQCLHLSEHWPFLCSMYHSLSNFSITLFAMLMCANPVLAKEEIYLEPEAFIAQSFSETPEQKVVWLTQEVKDQVRSILGHDYPGLRIRYWQQGIRTAWILEEIGKVKPITTGFLIEDNRMLQMQVLIYRESHGWEVRYPFFTEQFTGLEIDDSTQLNKSIDGISGATLSVNALTRLSRLALYLHSQATTP